MKAPVPEKRGRFWCIRVRVSKTERPWIPVAKASANAERAADRAAEWHEHREERIAAWLAARERERAEERARAPKLDDGRPATTVAQLSEAWTSGALLRLHGRVNRLRDRKLASARDVLRRCCATRPRGESGPTFGELRAADVTEEDVEACLRHGPLEGASARTVLSYYGALHRLFDLAERPCRLRPRGSSPVDRSMRPALDPEKIYSFLLPSEVLAVLALRGAIRGRGNQVVISEESLLRWKVLLVLGCYLGLRKRNLQEFTWGDLAAETGSFVALRTKTGVAIHATLHFPCVAEILERWRKHTPARDTDPIVAISDRQGRRARQVLHIILRAAGVDREILFREDEQVEPIRFHDLRSTFVTWAKRAGLSDDFIKARTGHMTQTMIERYAKLATSVEAATFVPFPDVSDAIPELATFSATSKDGDGGGGGDPRESLAEALGTLVRSSVFKTDDLRRQESLAAEIAAMNAIGDDAEAPSEPPSPGRVATGVATRIAELRGLARCPAGPPELAALEQLEADESLAGAAS